MRFSVDTNVFVYLSDSRDPARQETAQDLIEQFLARDTWVGLQVVGELQNALRRRLRKPQLEASGAASFVFTAFPSFAYGEADVSGALQESAAERFSYWDALLLSASHGAGCDLLFSEDMQDGGRFEGVRIVNPFRPRGGLSDSAREALAP